jgi:lipopolysaccharide transport system permease protein
MVVLTIVFGYFGRMPDGGVPYPILVFCGMLPWQFFSTALSESGNSLVTNSSLISKVYFPRLVVPVSSVITSFVDFLIAGAFLIGLLFWYQFVPSARVLFLPAFVLLTLAAALAAGLWTAALMVRYRDFRFIVPFVVQLGLYISPVGFLSTVVPAKWHILYSVNPMVGIIDGFRWSILGGVHQLYWPGLSLCIIGVVLLLVSGVWYFRRTERTFADII